MRRDLLVLVFLLVCFIAIPVSFASEDNSNIEVGEINHDYDGDHSNLYINGYLDGYSRNGEGYPEGNVKLKIVGKNCTKEVSDYSNGNFYFSVPITPGTFSYTISYEGNSYFNPATYTNTYTIPKKSTNLAVNTKLGIKKIIVTTKLYEDDYGDDIVPLSGKPINIKMGNKNYYTKTNSNGIATFNIPSSTGNKNLLVSFLGSCIYNGKTISKKLSISSYSVVSSKTNTKFVKYTEKGNYLYRKYKQTVKKYYFNGKTKNTSKYLYKLINKVKTVKFGDASSSKIVENYADGYLSVDKYKYLKEIGIYDYISYDNRYLDYFKIFYSSGKTKKVDCTHYFSRYWIFNSNGVSKIKFYFFC